MSHDLLPLPPLIILISDITCYMPLTFIFVIIVIVVFIVIIIMNILDLGPKRPVPLDIQDTVALSVLVFVSFNH
jgi:hypothetical protein